MRGLYLSVLSALAVTEVLGHATWQELWVNGVDKVNACVRNPPSNSPVTLVSSTDIRCNVQGAFGVSGKCTVAAGQTITVEMHQQPGDRNCATEAIGGAHYGPVIVYMSKVSSATTADGSTGWFKIFQNGLVNGVWGTQLLNNNCGKMDVQIPSDLAPGDYLVRAEAIALHAAGSVNGAQLYMSCFQITLTGTGTASPSVVQFPGAYKSDDPGILIDIYRTVPTYTIPGPTVYGGNVGGGGGAHTATAASVSVTVVAPTATASGGGCTAAKYGQCGGSGWTGCTACVSGSTCSHLNDYYWQCV